MMFEIFLQYQISANTVREKGPKTEVDDSTDLDDIGDKYFFFILIRQNLSFSGNFNEL